MSENTYESLKMAIECQKLADKNNLKLTINSEQNFIQLSKMKSSDGAIVFGESIIPVYEYLTRFEDCYKVVADENFLIDIEKGDIIIKDKYHTILVVKNKEVLECKFVSSLIKHYLAGYKRGIVDAGTK
jgi:histone deacetylase complex regulatory component SIN3